MGRARTGEVSRVERQGETTAMGLCASIEAKPTVALGAPPAPPPGARMAQAGEDMVNMREAKVSEEVEQAGRELAVRAAVRDAIVRASLAVAETAAAGAERQVAPEIGGQQAALSNEVQLAMRSAIVQAGDAVLAIHQHRVGATPSKLSISPLTRTSAHSSSRPSAYATSRDSRSAGPPDGQATPDPATQSSSARPATPATPAVPGNAVIPPVLLETRSTSAVSAAGRLISPDLSTAGRPVSASRLENASNGTKECPAEASQTLPSHDAAVAGRLIPPSVALPVLVPTLPPPRPLEPVTIPRDQSRGVPDQKHGEPAASTLSAAPTILSLDPFGGGGAQPSLMGTRANDGSLAAAAAVDRSLVGTRTNGGSSGVVAAAAAGDSDSGDDGEAWETMSSEEAVTGQTVWLAGLGCGADLLERQVKWVPEARRPLVQLLREEGFLAANAPCVAFVADLRTRPPLALPMAAHIVPSVLPLDDAAGATADPAAEPSAIALAQHMAKIAASSTHYSTRANPIRRSAIKAVESKRQDGGNALGAMWVSKEVGPAGLARALVAAATHIDVGTAIVLERLDEPAADILLEFLQEIATSHVRFEWVAQHRPQIALRCSLR